MVTAGVYDRGLDRSKLLFLPLRGGFFWGILFYVFFMLRLPTFKDGIIWKTEFLCTCLVDRSLVSLNLAASGLTHLVIEGFIGRKIGPVVFCGFGCKIALLET